MDFWKSKVLPQIKKVFDKSGTKKAAAAEAVKSFDASKDEYNKVFEEKKTELQPKVVEIYEATSVEIKSLVKEPNEAALKKNSTAVHKFLEELVKIEFPGSKAVHEASSKYGPGLVSGPVIFVFEKVSTFIVTEEKEKTEAPAAASEEGTSGKEREIVAEEEKKEVVTEKAEETKVEDKSSVADPDPVPEAAKEEEKPAEPQPPKTEQEEPQKP
ncbi:hypothetical protein L6164_017043 [Bauhinia variegata]|uniref:Uncharacterized protein n=1 Tax=Bauhinia variegata TaxID=167791 RepID=A0ACB9N6S8_BAUVA|nr:hypothetical protein L6164_017043 [Bauhinia variegata]